MRALGGVGLHQVVLVGGKAAFLVQNGVRDGNFAHIVGDGAHADEAYLTVRKALAQRRFAQQQAGDIVDAADMLARFVTAELDGGGERLHHAHAHFGQLLGLIQKLVPLAFHLRAQQLPRGKQLHHRLHPPAHHKGHHRLCDHVHDAQIIGLLHGVVAGVGGDEEHRHHRREPALAQGAKQLDAVHPGHHHVQQDGTQGAVRLLDQLQRLQAVLRFEDVVVRLKNICQNGTVQLFVVHDEERVFFCRAHVSISLPVLSL